MIKPEHLLRLRKQPIMTSFRHYSLCRLNNTSKWQIAFYRDNGYIAFQFKIFRQSVSTCIYLFMYLLYLSFASDNGSFVSLHFHKNIKTIISK